MIRRPPRSTHCISSAASDVYKRQVSTQSTWDLLIILILLNLEKKRYLSTFMENQSQKKLVVISGASSGIGMETAKVFSKKGHPLLLLARRVEKMEQMKLPNCLCRKVDVTDVKTFQSAIDEAEKKYGPVDLLVNNAGVMLLNDATTQPIEEWNTMIDVNVKGLLNGIHCVVKGMKERKTGTVVNISSIAGRKTFGNHAVYCGTKFAVHAITENMREELSPFNVRFIVIAPGVVETELLSHTTNTEVAKSYKQWKDTLNDGKGLDPHDIASAIDYAYSQPQRICIREIVIAVTKQGQ
eukprot:TRINITY_DN1429_c0_g4_i1.p1 TRINITY_DN1429_c0_g4~~TRINITY_DN1429_c0_g4_i1.p1  ORF type:complete len:297 (-),score=70.19 TRINITY_DN1429_c0_g4_i1:280-1170(-)